MRQKAYMSLIRIKNGKKGEIYYINIRYFGLIKYLWNILVK